MQDYDFDLQSIQAVRDLARKGKIAANQLAHYDEEQIDRILRNMVKVAEENAQVLASMAVEETGFGKVCDKVYKNHIASALLYEEIRDKKTIGVIDADEKNQVISIAEPVGLLMGIVPSTNPTSTVIYKAMIALKARNAIVFSPHPAAAKCTGMAIQLMNQAAVEAGAPENVIQGITLSSMAATNELMHAPEVAMIIATGGPGMVKAVYSCGRPGFGVGQGNCQEIICDDYEDLDKLAMLAINNRSYDNGVPCTSEQTMHVPESKEAAFLEAMQNNGAFLIEDAELIEKLRKVVFPDGEHINRDVVGRSPQVVGEMIGVEVPADRKTLLCKYTGCAEDDVLAKEILFPFVRYVTYTDFKATVAAAVANLEMEGAGHNSAIWTNDQEKIEYAAHLLPVSRFQINQTPFGINNGMPTTTTLGCGSWGNNSISENLEWYHLMNTTRVSVTLPNKRLWKDGDWDLFDECPVTED